MSIFGLNVQVFLDLCVCRLSCWVCCGIFLPILFSWRRCCLFDICFLVGFVFRIWIPAVVFLAASVASVCSFYWLALVFSLVRLVLGSAFLRFV